MTATTQTLIFPPSCQVSSQTLFTPGCLPCPDNINTFSAPSLYSYYPPQQSGQNLPSGAIKRGPDTYYYQVLAQCPLEGNTQKGLSLFFSVCQSQLSASLFILDSSTTQMTASSIGQALTAYYNNQTVKNAIRVNMGEPYSGVLSDALGDSYARPGQVLSVTANAEIQPLEMLTLLSSQGTALKTTQTIGQTATIQTIINPFPTTFVALYINPNTGASPASTLSAKKAFMAKHGTKMQRATAATPALDIQFNLSMQSQPFQGANINVANQDIYNTTLVLNSTAQPLVTLTPTSNVIFVLVWHQSCNLMTTSINLVTENPQSCQNWPACTPSQSTAEQPPVYAITSFQPVLTNIFFPSKINTWQGLSTRTEILWSFASLLQPNSNSTDQFLPPRASLNTSKALSCNGINLLMYTGQVNTPNFMSCPPFTGGQSSTFMPNNNLIRVVLGGSPGLQSPIDSLPTGSMVSGTNVTTPDLIGITSVDTFLNAQLTANQQTAIIDPDTNQSIAPSLGIWSLLSSQMPSNVIPFLNQMTQPAGLANYVHFDISIIEIGTEIYCVIRGIPYSTIDNPYVNTSDGGKQTSFPAYNPAITQGVTSENFAALQPGNGTYPPLPVLNTTRVNKNAVTPVPTLVFSLNSNPLSSGQRNLAVNIAQGENYCFATSYYGLPGYEPQGTSGVSIPPPFPVAQVDFTIPVSSLFLVTQFPYNINYPTMSIIVQSAPIAQVCFGPNANPIIPCVRLLLNNSVNNQTACCITDGNDSLITQTQSPTVSYFSQSDPIVNGYAYVLWSFTSDATTVYVWMNQSGPTQNDTMPVTAPTHILELSYNPLLFCNLQQSLHVYSHSMISSRQAAMSVDFTNDKLTVNAYSDISKLGALNNFACPPNLVDVTQSLNFCRSNVQSSSQYLMDPQQDPLSLVGVFHPQAAAQAESFAKGVPFRQVLQEKGKLIEEIQTRGKEARASSHKPEDFLKLKYGVKETANYLAMSSCPNNSPVCVPPMSNNGSFNYNYNSIATACPLPSSFDDNVAACLTSWQPCPGNKCNPDAPASIINPKGQCGNPNECTLWLQTAPNISRSCLSATEISTLGSLGPFMPTFTPDPSACALPSDFGYEACPSVNSNMCNIPLTNGLASYTSECYNPLFEGATGPNCMTSGGGTQCCDTPNAAKKGCAPPSDVQYLNTSPCTIDNGTSNVAQTSRCTQDVDMPTIASISDKGLFPFAQLPCAANTVAVATSSFPGKTNAVSNEVTCPQATADEAAWYQTVFSCQMPQIESSLGYNQFGQAVVPPPVAGDITGQSVQTSACKSTSGSPSGLALNPNWSASCTADSQNNPAVLFTYTGNIDAAYIYPQACIDPSVIAANSPVISQNPTKGNMTIGTQLSYCTTGDGSSNGCTNQMAQFMVTQDSSGYIPVQPKSWQQGGTTALVCGAIDNSVWGQNYPAQASASPTVDQISTMGVRTDRPQYALANMFTPASTQSYYTTGRRDSIANNTSAIPVNVGSSGSNKLPNGMNLYISNDTNLMSVLPQQVQGAQPYLKIAQGLKSPQTFGGPARWDGGQAAASAVNVTPYLG